MRCATKTYLSLSMRSIAVGKWQSLIIIKQWTFSWRFWPPCLRGLEFQFLLAMLGQVNLNSEKDKIVWKVENNGIFSSNSSYKFIDTYGVKCRFAFSSLRSFHILLKIKRFIWFY